MDRRTLLSALALSVLGVQTAGCLDTGDGDADEAAAQAESIPPDARGNVVEEETHDDLDIEDSQLYLAEDAYGVLGTVVNVGDEPVTDVHVEVRLLDADDAILGEFSGTRGEAAGIWRLEPGETEDFTIEFPDVDPSTVQDVVRYEIWAYGQTATGA